MSDEKNWLERMHAFLRWHVVAPEPNTPFGPPMSDKVLEELSTKKDILKKYVEIKASMDGEELLTLKSVEDLKPTTAHPELSKMKKADFRRYLEEQGIMDQVEKDLDEIQERYKGELEHRSAGATA